MNWFKKAGGVPKTELKFIGTDRPMFGSGKSYKYDIMLDGKEIGYVEYSSPKLGFLKLEDIRVADEYQKQGIATDIVERLLKKTKSILWPSGQTVSDAGRRLQEKFRTPNIGEDI